LRAARGGFIRAPPRMTVESSLLRSAMTAPAVPFGAI
jgi:hypothetical protein